MSLDFVKCITSEVFELIAEGNVRFFIHRDILAFQSKPLREAVNGEWKEATEREINLTDWDGDTVGRMVQFMYTGDYMYPDPDSIQRSPIQRKIVSEVPTLSEKPVYYTELDSDRPLTPLNQYLSTILPPYKNERLTDEERLQNFYPTLYDFEHILLAHAKVYALAHYKSINVLKQLALHRLLITLRRINPIQPQSQIASSFANLATFVYTNTDPLVSSEEPLRGLVSQFAALNFRELQADPRIVELYCMGGDFVKDVMAKLCRRLPNTAQLYTNHRQRFVAKLKVVFQSPNDHPPPDHVRELGSGRGNINHPSDNLVFLVPEYTNLAHNAATSLQLSSEGALHRPADNIAWWQSISCYIDAVADVDISSKITDVALLRCYHALSAVRGYDGISSNIMEGWGSSDYLYLVWKTIIVIN